MTALYETVFGVLLHDIGKFRQRADPSIPPEVQARESVILPVHDGRYTHRHALHTDAFFHSLERQGLHLPQGVSASRVRDIAVYHHNPRTPDHWICAEADRLSSSLERKEKDRDHELTTNFRSTPLLDPFSRVRLHHPEPLRAYLPLAEFSPASDLFPVPDAAQAASPERYRALYASFLAALPPAFNILPSLPIFEEALLSLSERFLHAIPSSTINEPDISLHDHSRVAAAIAAALFLFHQHHSSLHDTAAICNRSLPKFRFLAADLSGIQNTLFLLASQQVRGVSRILRARSFLLSMTVEAAAHLIRQTFQLPAVSVLQSAGGRLLFLLPNLPALETQLLELRATVDRWLLDRYLGELSLNLALSPAFAGDDLGLKAFPSVLAQLGAAIEAAKLHPLATAIPNAPLPISYPNGPCTACGARPALHPDPHDEATIRCSPCDQDALVGRALTRTQAIAWSAQPPGRETVCLPFFNSLHLCLLDKPPLTTTGFFSIANLNTPSASNPFATRFLAAYVPRLSPDEVHSPRYHNLSDEAREIEPGDLKTFEHLAADAPDDSNLGEPLLAVLKADVDRLGAIFSSGLQPATSLSRMAALSRRLDSFFSAYLPYLLEKHFPSTYTVYAGGDDLLLIGPWRQTVHLAQQLYDDFRRFTAQNPNVTLSAGLELIKPHHPINRAAGAADERLDAAKSVPVGKGRNQICLLHDAPLPWQEFAVQRRLAAQLSQYLRDGKLSLSFVYRLLHFDTQRLAADHAKNLAAANWRARFAYSLARQQLKPDLAAFVASLLHLDQALHLTLSSPQLSLSSRRVAISLALYENRKSRS